jgi:hypothetical protein
VQFPFTSFLKFGYRKDPHFSKFRMHAQSHIFLSIFRRTSQAAPLFSYFQHSSFLYYTISKLTILGYSFWLQWYLTLHFFDTL